MPGLEERFGTMVFSDKAMQAYLPKDVYTKLRATIDEGEPLDMDVANVVAHAMGVCSPRAFLREMEVLSA